MKLFKVTCRGMQESYGTAFVVADNPSAAYQSVLESLNKRDLGFAKDRELLRIELIADRADYPNCGTTLYLPTPPKDSQP